MTVVVNYGCDLARRLYPRYRGEWENVATLDDLMRNEAVIALIQFLFIGLAREDLQPEEVSEALTLATEGNLLKSSAWLKAALTDYKRLGGDSHSPAPTTA